MQFHGNFCYLKMSIDYLEYNRGITICNKKRNKYAKLILPNVYIWFITTCFSLHIADVFDLKIVLSNQGQHSLLHSHAFSRFLQKMTHLDFALNYYQTKV